MALRNAPRRRKLFAPLRASARASPAATTEDTPTRCPLAPLPNSSSNPRDAERLANLAGPFDGHLRQIELRLGVEIANRGNVFRVTGTAAGGRTAERLLRDALTRRRPTRRSTGPRSTCA